MAYPYVSAVAYPCGSSVEAYPCVRSCEAVGAYPLTFHPSVDDLDAYPLAACSWHSNYTWTELHQQILVA